MYKDLTNQQPKPFDWRFTKHDLFRLLQRIAKREAARNATSGRETPNTEANAVG
jgi:hypothetical protein